MRVYGVANIKGGCGKSSVILNLALYHVRKGDRAIFLDLDEYQASSSYLEATGLGGVEEDAPLYCPVMPKRPVLDDILVDLEKRFPDAVVFVDTPANSTELISQLGMNADQVFIPLLPDPMSRTMLMPTLKVLERSKKANPALKYCAVLIGASYQRRSLVRGVEQALGEVELPLARSYIPDRVALTGNFGKAVVVSEYAELYHELFGGTHE